MYVCSFVCVASQSWYHGVGLPWEVSYEGICQSRSMSKDLHLWLYTTKSLGDMRNILSGTMKECLKTLLSKAHSGRSNNWGMESAAKPAEVNQNSRHWFSRLLGKQRARNSSNWVDSKRRSGAPTWNTWDPLGWWHSPQPNTNQRARLWYLMIPDYLMRAFMHSYSNHSICSSAYNLEMWRFGTCIQGPSTYSLQSNVHILF